VDDACDVEPCGQLNARRHGVVIAEEAGKGRAGQETHKHTSARPAHGSQVAGSGMAGHVAHEGRRERRASGWQTRCAQGVLHVTCTQGVLQAANKGRCVAGHMHTGCAVADVHRGRAACTQGARQATCTQGVQHATCTVLQVTCTHVLALDEGGHAPAPHLLPATGEQGVPQEEQVTGGSAVRPPPTNLPSHTHTHTHTRTRTHTHARPGSVDMRHDTGDTRAR
jgi:hypothetical protein